jgi:hypothetical protein
MTFWIFLSLLNIASAFYSISYSADENYPQIVGSPVVFKVPPSPEHVADIFSRLSGKAPILREGVFLKFHIALN